MKRLLACLLILVGFVLAGCEEEEHEHAHEYRYPEHREYPEHRGYRLKDETLLNDGIVQDEAAVEQQ